MKQLILLLFPLFLFSCFGESKEIQQAKQDLLWEPQQQDTASGNMVSETPSDATLENVLDWETLKSSYHINYLTDKFIDIDPIVNIEKITDTLDIKWVINNPDIDKIVVSFSNKTSNFPEDRYILKTFKKWDKTFLYRAYKKYEVLDTGKNIYKIEAYVWESLIAQLELEISLVENVENTLSWSGQNTQTGVSQYIPKSIWDENTSVFLHLPVHESTYGNPIMTGESSFTYSNISWFEVKKSSDTFERTCENIWDLLKQNYSWYYWNTCRPIYEDSFSFNVLSLSGDTYTYEKHYIDRKYNFYGVVFLETGSGVSQEQLATKAEELKGKTFEVSLLTDSVFKDMLK